MKPVSFLDPLDTFAPRHIGPRGDEVAAMLKAVGAASLDQLIDEALPASIRLKAPLDLPAAESESAYLGRLKGSNEGARNRVIDLYAPDGEAIAAAPLDEMLAGAVIAGRRGATTIVRPQTAAAVSAAG